MSDAVPPRPAGVPPAPPSAAALYAVAERENPRRRFLFVSRVLGKHLPIDPRVGRLAGAALALVAAGDPRAAAGCAALDAHDGAAAAELLADLARTPARLPGGDDVAVVGFAETATALGHAVGDALHAAHVGQTTRRAVPGATPLTFVEEHSHAPDQWLFAPPPGEGTVVIVDDEMTTGRTAANLVRALHAQRPRRRYLCLALIDRLGGEGRAMLAAVGEELGCAVDVVSLRSCADAVLPAEDATPVGAVPAARVPQGAEPAPDVPPPLVVRGGPASSARTGLDAAGGRLLLARARADAATLRDRLPPGPVRVIGFGEYLHQPMAVAAALADARDDVRFWSTTRSPVRVAADDGTGRSGADEARGRPGNGSEARGGPGGGDDARGRPGGEDEARGGPADPDEARAGYPIRAGLAFPLPEAPETPGFLYSAEALAGATVVLCPERASDLDHAGPLLAELAAAGASARVLLVPEDGAA